MRLANPVDDPCSQAWHDVSYKIRLGPKSLKLALDLHLFGSLAGRRGHQQGCEGLLCKTLKTLSGTSGQRLTFWYLSVSPPAPALGLSFCEGFGQHGALVDLAARRSDGVHQQPALCEVV